MAAELSLLLGWIEQPLVDRIKHLILQTGLPIAPPQVPQFPHHSVFVNVASELI